MARVVERLTDRQCRVAKTDGSATMLPDGKGLYLRIAPAGSKSWIYRYEADGHRHDLGLGPYPEITLADARDKALEHRRARLQGIDPLDRKRASQAPKLAVMTFAEASERYFEANKAGWAPRHAKLWLSSMQQHAFPVLGKLPVAAVDLPAVLRVLEPLWQEKTETASRLRARIENTLAWATTRGYRSGDNPARWQGHLDTILPSPKRIKTVERFAALPYRDMPEFMDELRRLDGIGFRALELAILTACRSGEVLGAEWTEFDLTVQIWTIPAERTKTRKEHRVPLSDGAMAVVEAMAAVREGAFVFAGINGPANHNAIRRALQRLRSDVQTHGFRSTFRDWAAERTAYPEIVAEMALGHQVGSAVERAYRRSDLFEQRRRLMQDWARYCSAPQNRGEVVAIRSA